MKVKCLARAQGCLENASIATAFVIVCFVLFWEDTFTILRTLLFAVTHNLWYWWEAGAWQCDLVMGCFHSRPCRVIIRLVIVFPVNVLICSQFHTALLLLFIRVPCTWRLAASRTHFRRLYHTVLHDAVSRHPSDQTMRTVGFYELNIR